MMFRPGKKQIVLMGLVGVLSAVACPTLGWAQEGDTDSSSTPDTASAVSRAEAEEREHQDAKIKADELLAAPDVPEGTPAVSLIEALQLTAKRNLTLKQLALEIDKADARLRMARTAFMPNASADLKYIMADHADEVDMGDSTAGIALVLNEFSRQMNESLGTSYPPIVTESQPIEMNPKHTVSGSITVSQPLVNISGWRNFNVAKSGAEIAQMSIEESRRTIMYATARAYFGALMSKTLVDLYKEQIAATRAHLRVAEEKYLAGSGLRIDLLRATIDFEQAEQDLLVSRVSLGAACDALGVLTGADGGMVAPKSAEVLPPSEDTGTLEKDALARRMDVKLKRKRAEVAGAQVNAAQAELLPSLNLAWQGSYLFTEPGGFGSTDRSRWNLVLALSIPLFNNYTHGKIAENRALNRQAELEIDTLSQSVKQEVRQAKREHETALANVRGAERRVRLAKESLQLAESAYAAGAGTSLEVTDVRRMYLQAEVDLATTELKTQLTLLDLLESIGETPSDMIKSD